MNDWAARAAHYIKTQCGRDVSEERLAAIIATFAAPLVGMLRGAMKEHYEGFTASGPPCPKALDEDAECNCGADAWNQQLREVK